VEKVVEEVTDRKVGVVKNTLTVPTASAPYPLSTKKLAARASASSVVN
jgi:hypothetical protein